MIRHIVLFKLRKNKSSGEKITKIIRATCRGMSGIHSITAGICRSRENLNQKYNYGFTIEFRSIRDRDSYLRHPKHAVAAKKIFEIIKHDKRRVIVFDFKV